MQEEIKKVLEEVRPSLQADGGDVEFVSFDEKTGVVSVRLVGACAHCAMSTLTLKEGIEKLLISKVEGVKEVVQV
jgi:Fe-S cluster biogenesis protein NfuA